MINIFFFFYNTKNIEIVCMIYLVKLSKFHGVKVKNIQKETAGIGTSF